MGYYSTRDGEKAVIKRNVLITVLYMAALDVYLIATDASMRHAAIALGTAALFGFLFMCAEVLWLRSKSR